MTWLQEQISEQLHQIRMEERSRVERQSAQAIAAIVAASGGEVRVPVRWQLADLTLVVTKDPFDASMTYRTEVTQ